MPYIDPEARPAIDAAVADMQVDNLDAGELNYLISVICDRWATRNETFRYEESILDVVGTLECVKLEFYRKCAAAYEDGKERANGTVHNRCLAAIAGWLRRTFLSG